MCHLDCFISPINRKGSKTGEHSGMRIETQLSKQKSRRQMDCIKEKQKKPGSSCRTDRVTWDRDGNYGQGIAGVVITGLFKSWGWL